MSAPRNPSNTLTNLISTLTFTPFLYAYHLLQLILSYLFSPTPPPPGTPLHRPSIAIIGAGLTGVSAAAHCIGHGFSVTLFEAGDEDALGGIWSRVNSTSGLQIHSAMYRFHPSVTWDGGYPKQSQIVGQVRALWERYGLRTRTKFETRVESVEKRPEGRWVVNGDEGLGKFDGVIAAVGTCGEPKEPTLQGQGQFEGEIYHSSKLDGKEAKGKTILIVGGGASAVEALEWAVQGGAKEIKVLSRSEKWIIPRNIVVDALLAFNIFGQETIFSWIPETILRLFFYRDLTDISPSGQGLFTETPMVNSEILAQIRNGTASWLRGDILTLTRTGIKFSHRSRGVPKSGPGQEELLQGDAIILATGYERPSLSFLPDSVFEQPYAPPRWYLQVFPPTDPSVLAANCTYVNAIGTVGNYHIGIYTRLLLMFLVDPLATPRPVWMKRWIEMTSTLKRLAPTGAFDFFTYSELIYWFCFVVLINPFRWKWALFVFCGVGKDLPARVVAAEDRLRDRKWKDVEDETMEEDNEAKEKKSESNEKKQLSNGSYGKKRTEKKQKGPRA